MAYSQDFINTTIGKIQILHARFADELCNILKKQTGDNNLYDKLISVNIHVGWTIELLYDYNPYGITSVNDANNTLSETDLRYIIEYCYRILNKYGSKIFLPQDRNIIP